MIGAITLATRLANLYHIECNFEIGHLNAPNLTISYLLEMKPFFGRVDICPLIQPRIDSDKGRDFFGPRPCPDWSHSYTQIIRLVLFLIYAEMGIQENNRCSPLEYEKNK